MTDRHPAIEATYRLEQMRLQQVFEDGLRKAHGILATSWKTVGIVQTALKFENEVADEYEKTIDVLIAAHLQVGDRDARAICAQIRSFLDPWLKREPIHSLAKSVPMSGGSYASVQRHIAQQYLPMSARKGRIAQSIEPRTQVQLAKDVPQPAVTINNWGQIGAINAGTAGSAVGSVVTEANEEGLVDDRDP